MEMMMVVLAEPRSIASFIPLTMKVVALRGVDIALRQQANSSPLRWPVGQLASRRCLLASRLTKTGRRHCHGDGRADDQAF